MPRAKGGPGVARDFSSVSDVFVPYRRVSTREQAISGAGLAAQKTKIRMGLAFKDLKIHNWDCVDEGKSGKDLKRDGLDQALKIVRSGEASGIVVSKLDRLSRRVLDYSTLMDTAQKEGWSIIILDPDIDLRNPIGKMIAGILALFAEFERDMISQRTMDGLAEKRAAGVRLGRPRSVDDRVLKQIIRAYVQKPNYSAIARWLNETGVPTPQGGKMWYPMTISNIVNSQDAKYWLERFEAAVSA